ncbi:ferredoxin [Clostridium perfringens]|nr:ferredoxin [Clostridium perfringens]
MSKSHKKIKRHIRENKEVIYVRPRRCIACTACALTCAKSTKISVLRLSLPDKKVIVPKKDTFDNSNCIYCGQCTLFCPTGAIDSDNPEEKVLAAKEANKYMVAIFAPSVRATLGEEFNLPIGTDVSPKLATSARLAGFNKVFETDFGADLTIVEEAHELLERIKNNGILPMFTSCCPAWINWVERFRRDLLPHISTCKSPQQMIGATIKTYFAEKNNLAPENIFVTSIKPCTAKKFEATRNGMGRNNYSDINAVFTVREYANFLKEKGININNIPSTEPDDFLDTTTAGGAIFGSSGGLLRSALRTLLYYLKETPEEIEKVANIRLTDLEGFSGVKVINYKTKDLTLKTAAVSGISNLIKFLDSGLWKDYQFIEVMACSGGCVNGGGAPKVKKEVNINEKLCISCGTCIDNCPAGALEFNSKKVSSVSRDRCVRCTLCSNLCRSNAISMDYYDKSTNTKLERNYIDLRKEVLENIDKTLPVKYSHENKDIKELYKSYLGNIGGSKAEDLLHIKYN